LIMATQTVVLRRKKKAGHGGSFCVQTPTWYPYQDTGTYSFEADDDAIAKIVRVQAIFRGRRGRLHARRVFQKTVFISIAGFRAVTLELKKFHLGWKYLCNHLLLLAFVTVVATFQLMVYAPTAYGVDEALKNAVDSIQFPGGDFNNVRKIEDIQAFAMGVIDELYSHDPYYVHSAECQQVLSSFDCNSLFTNQTLLTQVYNCSNITEYAGYLDSYNRQQFGLLLRQERRVMKSCDDDDIDLYSDVGKNYNESHSETKCATDDIATKYNSVLIKKEYLDTVSNDSVFKSAFIFDSQLGGFFDVVDLGILNLNKEYSKCYMDFLFNKVLWVDRATKSMCFQLMVHNSNGIGRYGYFNLCFDIVLGGDIQPRLDIQSAQLLKKSNQTVPIVLTILYMVCICANLIFLAYSTYRALWRKHKGVRISQSKNVNWFALLFDLTVLAMHLATTITYFRYVAQSDSFRPYGDTGDESSSLDLDQLVEGVVNLKGVIENLQQLRLFYAILLILMAARTIMFLDFHPDTAIVSKTISNASSELLSFAFVYIIVVVSYSFIGLLMLGPRSSNFETFQTSLSTLLFVSMGEFGDVMPILFDEVQSAQMVAQLFFWSYVFLTSLILFNILLSIVVDSFVTFQDLKKEKKTVGYIESFLIFVFVLWFDWKRFYWAKIALFLTRCTCKTKHYEQEKDTNKEGDVGIAMKTLSKHESMSFYGKDHSSAETEEFYNQPHTFLMLLNFMKSHCPATTTTFVVRHQFTQVFPSAVVEKLLALFRDRTAMQSTSYAHQEAGVFFRDNESQLYIIDLIRQLSQKVDKQLDASHGPGQRKNDAG